MHKLSQNLHYICKQDTIARARSALRLANIWYLVYTVYSICIQTLHKISQHNITDITKQLQPMAFKTVDVRLRVFMRTVEAFNQTKKFRTKVKVSAQSLLMLLTSGISK